MSSLAAPSPVREVDCRHDALRAIRKGSLPFKHNSAEPQRGLASRARPLLSAPTLAETERTMQRKKLSSTLKPRPHKRAKLGLAGRVGGWEGMRVGEVVKGGVWGGGCVSVLFCFVFF